MARNRTTALRTFETGLAYKAKTVMLKIEEHCA